MKQNLTVNILQEEATRFAEMETSHDEPWVIKNGIVRTPESSG